MLFYITAIELAELIVADLLAAKLIEEKDREYAHTIIVGELNSQEVDD